MKIIISPAKKMNIENDTIQNETMPVFMEQTKALWELLRGRDYTELKSLWKCNDKIATLNYDRLQHCHLDENLTPALLSYEGIQYQYMAPQVFSDDQWEYVKQHVRILSGFYGLLRPMDGVIPYRLEMQAPFQTESFANLYQFWGRCIYEELAKNDKIILNLASKEYSRTVEPFLTSDMKYITCVFGDLTDGKVKVKGTKAKMARGEMVRWMAEKGIRDVNQIKEFEGLGYTFCPNYSEEETYVFLTSQQGKDCI